MLTSTLLPARYSCFLCAILFFLMVSLPITVHAQIPSYTANFITNYSDWTPVGGNVWSVASSSIIKQTSQPTSDPCKLLLTTGGAYNLSVATSQAIIAKVTITAWQNNDDMTRAGVSLTSNTTNGQGYCLLLHGGGATPTVGLLSDLNWDGWGWNETSFTYPFAVGNSYWFKLQLVNGTLYGKVWPDGTAEPTAWTVTQTVNTTTATGYPGLVASSYQSSPTLSTTATASFDSVAICDPGIIYVNSARLNDSQPGYTWATAKRTLTNAISIDATGQPTGQQIWVQSGTYKNTVSYSMTNGVAIYGGFAGTEPYNYDVTQRNFNINPTVLQGSGVSVFSNSGINNTAVLDGFTITGGSASNGGGIYNNNASPTLQNLIITGNKATGSGTNNGGGIYNTGSSSPTVINTVIANNSADNSGGGVYNNGGTPNFINVTIANNSAQYGGGMYNYNGTCYLDNCILSGNTATNSGSQLYRHGGTINLNNSCYYGTTQGTSITYNAACLKNTNPLFVNPAANDFSLQSGSPCLDAGNNNYFTGTPANSSYPYDVRGATNSRFINKMTGATNGTIDMGAYEYKPSSHLYYVKWNATGANNGTSWANAFTTLQAALALGQQSSEQIWVARGTYTAPSTGYAMLDGVAIYGGFAGTEPATYDVTQRNFIANTTILKGGGGRVINNTNALTSAAILDGFTITGGYDNSYDGGGGILNNGASPTLENLIITGNTATNYGGGMSNEYNSAPVLINAIIANNSCSGGNGGGIDNYSSSPTLINVTIANNSALNGGGIMDESSSTDIFDNCIVWGNTATTGAQFNISGSSTTTLNYSCYSPASNTGTFTGTGNITSDPLFVNPTQGDYRLKSGSPCLDKGLNSYFTGNSNYLYDIRGASYGRFVNNTTGATNGTIDMGAYEYNPLMNFFYVTPTGSSNGTSWSNPISIQGALNTAFSTCKILVADGSYTPTNTTVLQSNVKLYGGFAGTPGKEIISPTDLTTKLNSRNLKANASVLTNASAPVVSSTGSVTGALLDGFTITGATGGSAYAVNFPAGADTIQNCKIINNAGTTGGINLNTSNVAANLLVADNSGVGINFAGTSAKVVNATIANNTGVGINCSDASNLVNNSILWGNGANTSSTTAPTMDYCAASSNDPLSMTDNTKPWPFATGTHNIELYRRSPNFKDGRNANLAKRNYELLLISPCLSQGSATANPLTIDANGKPRKYSGSIDMGAFEKWDGYVVNSGTGNNTLLFRTTTPAFNSAALFNIGTASGQDSVEVQVTPGANLTMANNTIYVKWLELMQDTTSSLPAQVTKGTMIADSVLYVRRFSKTLNNGTSTTKGVWTFFGVPFNTAPMSTLDGAVDENSVRIEGYKESSRATLGVGNAWHDGRLISSSSMTAGTGYALSFNSKVPQTDIGQTVIFSSPSQVTFDETASPVTQPVALSATTAPLWYNSGWNFIANPLPQTAGATWTASTPYYGAAYFYMPYTDSYDVRPAGDLTSGSYAIAPNAAFFVQTDMDGVAAIFTSGTSGTGKSPLQSMAYVRPSSSNVTAATVQPATFQFKVANGENYSNTYVVFDPNAHAAMEPMEDNPTMAGMSGNPALQLSTTATGSVTALAINRLPFTDSTKEVPMQVYAPTAGSYTITMPESDTIANTVLLQDAKGALHDLTTGAYTFTTTAEGVTNNFTLIFGSKSTDTQVVKGITILQDHRNVTISSIPTMQQVAVYGEGGQTYYMQNPNSTQLTLQLPAASGVYLLKVVTTSGVITKKMVSR